MHYIEEYLQHYVEVIGVKDKNKNILESINRQCKKSIALTDKQYALVTQILTEQIGDECECLPVQMPLREIDRSKYIKIVNNAELYKDSVPYESYKNDWLWIKIRFPFSKKLILVIDKLLQINRKYYHHNKGSHEHYFRLNSKNAISIYYAFKEKSFDIDETIVSYVKKCEDIINNKHEHIPFISDTGLQNATKHTTNEFEKSITQLNDKYILKDRSLRFGYEYASCSNNLLIDDICNRKTTNFLAQPSKYTINNVVEVLHKLDRWPLIAVVDDSESFDQVYNLYRSFNGIVNNEEQSILFRADSSDLKNTDLNSFIKEYKLNNWVDNNTKIVYIKKSKLPKVLLKSNFKPQTAFFYSSIRANTYVSSWINFNCDLQIFYDEQFSNFRLGGSYSWQPAS
jgi:hypothetical protein